MTALPKITSKGETTIPKALMQCLDRAIADQRVSAPARRTSTNQRPETGPRYPGAAWP